MTTLTLVEDRTAGSFGNSDYEESAIDGVTFCSCGRALRPEGTDASQYPGTSASWGNNQCRACDYLAAGRDPEDRFITQDRIAYLSSLRRDLEAARRRRGVPSCGLIPAGRVPISTIISAIDSKGAR
ncbi:hypothetical protein [Arthrobacter caoxuetaonis]|uniref:Uncharacterized protein n=1 Tax=Arthrobacter caoxuetaonis TaxID=2886935 RepID=A0A9X1MGQ2_9MICC|nr:hypothetical protein [Arthrobacter caoxuetaonis]MCC3299769.1 hypothetical protein [Arthrobacter caoxuetaonis]USQ59330.1 hypothetical protein NF551_17250 [Arthrobacter caoxuetaonis]